MKILQVFATLSIVIAFFEDRHVPSPEFCETQSGLRSRNRHVQSPSPSIFALHDRLCEADLQPSHSNLEIWTASFSFDDRVGDGDGNNSFVHTAAILTKIKEDDRSQESPISFSATSFVPFKCSKRIAENIH
jgi:hypothetical protein